VNIYFTNTKTGNKFKLVRMDKDTGIMVLEGEYGQFEEKYDKDWLTKNGYVLEKVADDDV
jgi:hypothetical protein